MEMKFFQKDLIKMERRHIIKFLMNEIENESFNIILRELAHTCGKRRLEEFYKPDRDASRYLSDQQNILEAAANVMENFKPLQSSSELENISAPHSQVSPSVELLKRMA